MKKLLILGAMEMHVPLILRAQELGYYVIVCDYIPEAPGHKLANESYLDSTTDLEAILTLSKKLKIDGIMTYNSDPAAPTVAYVAEQLGLPGNSYNTVKIMSEKNLFRQFLKDNNLNYPKFGNFKDKTEALSNLDCFNFPVIIKPVDSSGSKGVSVVHNKIEISKAIDYAIEKSRCKKFIIEEYIEPFCNQLHGDGFVKDGKLEFIYLGDHHFDSSINNLVPYSTTFPTSHSQEIVDSCKEQIQTFLTKVGFKNGGFNVELRISKSNMKPYIIDIGARNGGNFTPKVIEYGTGFNFMDKAIKLAVGDAVETSDLQELHYPYVSYLILHSAKSGIIKEIILSPEIENRLIEKHIYVHEGEKVEPFVGANSAIGVLLLKYESKEVMNQIVEGFEDYYKIEME